MCALAPHWCRMSREDMVQSLKGSRAPFEELYEGKYVDGVVDSKNRPLGYIKRVRTFAVWPTPVCFFVFCLQLLNVFLHCDFNMVRSWDS